MYNTTIYDPNTRIIYDNEICFRDNEDDLRKLMKIYKSYSQNEKLNLNSYLNFLQKVNILNNNFNRKYATAIFYSIVENNKEDKINLNFTNFCLILVKISELKYPDDYIDNPNFAYEKLLTIIFSNKNILTKFADVILVEKNIINNHKIDHETTLKKFSNTSKKLKYYYISKHMYLLSKIYDVYFPCENIQIVKNNYFHTNTNNPPQIQLIQSEKSFYSFCKDFELHNICGLRQLSEIFHSVISFSEIVEKVFKNITYINEDIFKEDLDNKKFHSKNSTMKNKGSYFTLFHLITAIYLLSFLKSKITYEHILLDDDVVKELGISKNYLGSNL